MKKNELYYIVSNERSLWPNNDEAIEPISSRNQETKVYDNNLLEARKKALEKAESLIRYFKEKPTELSYPTKKFNEKLEIESDFWINYQIRVFFMNGDEAFCIYDDGVGFESEFDDYINAEILNDLKKEFKIFKELNINTKQFEETISYFDGNMPKEITLLKNGMVLSNVKINQTIDIGSMSFDSDDSKNISRKDVKKDTNERNKFKTSLKYQFNANQNNVEIVIKTTTEIPIEIQNELSTLIAKWQKL